MTRGYAGRAATLAAALALVLQALLIGAIPPLRAIRTAAWRAQVRLSQRFRCLMAAGKPLPKVTTAIARELAGFVWDIARWVQVAPAASDRAV